MAEPTVPAWNTEGASPTDTVHSVDPPDPDLPEVLVPLHEEFGTWWRIEYHPWNRSAPYTARPRFNDGNGRTLRSDSVRLLARVLELATPDDTADEE
ncbi:hypothetical protein EFW17_01330 [Halostreptopolyspora alba]|uniref:Uncharacterized protein n=1 Tax=Halostreptopolyspora alba TaxID=2487137 RepID=A0A3N0EI77_9ACTN|nr:hypothetical protein EFW17_01330 [Nocardiopsaceae bacterium YIM 96095]